MTYSLFDFSEEVLVNSDKPLTYQEIWNRGVELELDKKLKLTGKTPWQSLGARLFVDVRDNPNSKFIKFGERPARFFLIKRKEEITEKTIEKIEKEEIKKEEKEEKEEKKWNERTLHPLLSYFVYANPAFGRGKEILTKTVFHEKSKKKGYNEWIYPDLIGFHLPLKEWEEDLIELGKISNNNMIQLYSFELKKSLNRGNYRASFFQAVSNSSWANEGYLVAADIKQEDDFLLELERLSVSFGIGIIQLDLNDFDSSTILYPARPKNDLDWETMNKICSQNIDFKKFLRDVKNNFVSKQIYKSEYDKIIEDPNKYICEVINK